ncbi:hypothetical protein SDC9_174248 [bioreactor metagenome]|uniref:Uncharacterized protein n=1 Tax=bioreactor metagenome TaxID=1076179 RepID=A0A645GT70_9ZZZZ
MDGPAAAGDPGTIDRDLPSAGCAGIHGHRFRIGYLRDEAEAGDMAVRCGDHSTDRSCRAGHQLVTGFQAGNRAIVGFGNCGDDNRRGVLDENPAVQTLPRQPADPGVCAADADHWLVARGAQQIKAGQPHEHERIRVLDPG